MPVNLQTYTWILASVLATCLVAVLCTRHLLDHGKTRKKEAARKTLDILLNRNRGANSRSGLIVLVNRGLRVPGTISIVKILGFVTMPHPTSSFYEEGHAMYLRGNVEDMREWLHAQDHVWVRSPREDSWTFLQLGDGHE